MTDLNDLESIANAVDQSWVDSHRQSARNRAEAYRRLVDGLYQQISLAKDEGANPEVIAMLEAFTAAQSANAEYFDKRAREL